MPQTRKRQHSSKPSPGAADSSCQLDVSLHDGDSLRMYGAQIGVVEQMHQKRLGGFLQGQQGVRLPPQFLTDADGQHGRGNVADKTRERRLAYQQIPGSLVPANLLQCQRARVVSSVFARDGITSYLRSQRSVMVVFLKEKKKKGKQCGTRSVGA